MSFEWPVVAVLLAVWIPVALGLAYGAERRFLQRRPPLPWRAAAVTCAIGACALLTRATPGEAAACGLACIALAAAAYADVRTGLLFDAVTLPAALLVTAAVALAGTATAAACGVALLVGTFGTLVAVSRGRWMGLGDVKAMFALGAAFGPLESLVAIFAACVSGIATSFVAGRLRRGSTLPFGPHLAAGGVFALVAGDPIVHRLMGV